MHEAKTRLSELVNAVEQHGETVILCRNGKKVAQITRFVPETESPIRRLISDPALGVTFADGYDPAEPATVEEWPEECR